MQNLQGKNQKAFPGQNRIPSAFDTILMQGIDHLCELCDGICGCSIRSFRSKIQGLCAVHPNYHALLFHRRRIYIGRLRKGGPLKKLIGRINSTALIPSSFKYGIFSITPRNVPLFFTRELPSLVKPRTWSLYRIVSSYGRCSEVVRITGYSGRRQQQAPSSFSIGARRFLFLLLLPHTDPSRKLRPSGRHTKTFLPSGL